MKLKKGLTFEDLLLVPNFSDILPKDVNLKTKLTNHIKYTHFKCSNGHSY